ncbi:MAG: MgtC/SapB family protein [Planctomycetaceae bacterium]|nr:MgtC/SapB family protein [Planctomycetaceae bacterium]
MDTFYCLSVAFVLGGLIGLERQYRQRNAGLKTNILVAVGSAVFVGMARTLFGDEGAIRVAACVVSGIGFLGAGVIMREAGTVFGLNTAAILWCSAAVGSCAGGELYTEAVIATFFILVTNTLLLPLANAISRRPVTLAGHEGVCAVFVIAERKNGKEVLTILRQEFKTRHYLIRRLDIIPFGGDELKVLAAINSSSADEKGLDSLVEALSKHEKVNQAFWSHGVTV